jgi:hypothetical protein
MHFGEDDEPEKKREEKEKIKSSVFLPIVTK